jgi:hypothetical protein
METNATQKPATPRQLAYIQRLQKENGIEKFLQKQEEKYKCPECGGVIYVHNNKCYSTNIIIK